MVTQVGFKLLLLLSVSYDGSYICSSFSVKGKVIHQISAVDIMLGRMIIMRPNMILPPSR